MLIFNPFDHMSKKDIKKRVDKIRKKKKNLSSEEICRMMIKKKCRWCAAAGALTALPGAVPVLGTVVAVIGGTLLDMTAMAYFITELILEIAVLHNRDIETAGTSREAVWVLISSVGAGAAGRGLTGVTVKRLSGRAFNRLLEQALLALGIRASQRTILRIIPFIGMFIAGSINYYICRKVGEFVMKYYAENSYTDKWDGETIDVEVIARGE
ncbi:hypothetical protein [Pelotomaculum propionicicum]|uniref:Uncharacterized protein n=1 Tax=Pelotomaculum propionicicum TaxID=258475 RepID=A0A4Y7RJ62_9FIRM|nr:hypothetical protein [Pelotomaculum propionicicum]TEB09058.1 hypothetical protein Pmgp_03410 [Pelotomaculum propionicicum]